MTMQFTWQGCDSILAAPLVIDLVRLVDRYDWLASRFAALAGKFFKSPLNCHEQGLAQMTMLHDWVAQHSAQPKETFL